MDKAAAVNSPSVHVKEEGLRLPAPIMRLMQRLNRGMINEESEQQAFSREKKLLLKDLDDTLLSLRCARMNFEQASTPEIIEACIYEIKSAESRYNFLLQKAKHMGLSQSHLDARERARRI